MSVYRTGLLLSTASKKDFKLPQTYSVVCIDKQFVTDARMALLYVVEDGITVYTTNPLKPIKTQDYKKKIDRLAVGRHSLYIINDDSLSVYSKSGFNVLAENFKDCTVACVEDDKICVQRSCELVIYTETFKKQATLGGQCSFFMPGVILVGEMNKAVVYINGVKKLEISMPDYINCMLSDPLFTKVICATQDNNVYCFDLNGQPLKRMEYHTRPVTSMKMSLCGQYLYSCDGQRLCVWDVKDCVVLGYIDVDECIHAFDLILVDDYCHSVDDLLI